MTKVNRWIAIGLSAAFLASPVSHAVEVTFERDPSLPLVFINVAIKSGAVSDPANKSGLTSMMGRILLRGTKNRTKDQIDSELDQLGAQLGVEVRSEALIYRGAVLSSNLGPYLSLLNEILTQPSFPDSEIKKLKSETISDILQTLSDDRTIAFQRFEQNLFQGHPYGNPVHGKRKDIQSINKKDLVTHYENLINSENLLVIGTGDASESQISDWSNQLANSKPGSSPAVTAVLTPKNPAHRRLVILDKSDRSQTQIYGGYVGVSMTDPDYFPLYVGNHAFGGGSFQARMMVEIRVKRGWSYGAYSYFRHGTKPRLWTFTLFPATQYTPEALGFTLDMVETAKQNGISKEEFEFAKKSLVNNAGFNYNTPTKRVENTLLEKTLGLPEGFMKSYANRISSLSHEDVNQALKKFLSTDQMLLIVLGTASKLKEKLAKAASLKNEDISVVPYDSETP